MPPAHSRAGSVSSSTGSQSTRRRLPERADVVLGGDVDRGLAADRRVDLADQRGRHREPRHAAPERRRGEPADIGHRAAADAHDHVGALELARGERAPHALEPGASDFAASPPSIAISAARRGERERVVDDATAPRPSASCARPGRVQTCWASAPATASGASSPATIASAHRAYCAARGSRRAARTTAASPASGRAPGAPSTRSHAVANGDVQPGAERALAHRARASRRTPAHRRRARSPARRRAPGASRVTLSSSARNAASPSRSNSSRTEQPAARSSSASASANGRPRRCGEQAARPCSCRRP